MAKPMLFYNPKPQFLDNTGSIAAGGKLFFYSPGTTTKKDTYTTSAASVANSNPIVLDSSGRPTGDIYLDGSYKVVLTSSSDTDPPASPYWTVDNVNTLGQLIQVSAKTTNYTVLTTDRDKFITADCSSGAITFTLPAASSAGAGFVIRCKKIDSSSNALTIDGNASELIDGALTFVLATTYEYAEFICDGTGWNVAQARVQVLRDTNGNAVLTLGTTASAVNGITVTNAATGNRPSITATGSDTNIGLSISSKGTGTLVFTGASTFSSSLSTTGAITAGTGVTITTGGLTVSSGGMNITGTSALAATTATTVTTTGQVTVGNTLVVTTGGITVSGGGITITGTTSGGAATFTGTCTLGAASLVFPTADGSRGAVVRTNGAGTLSIGGMSVQQQVRTVTGAVATGTTTVASTDTIPANTTGDQYMSLAITPNHASNILHIHVVAVLSHSATNQHMIMSLFQDSTANALASTVNFESNAAAMQTLTLDYYMTAGTTSATTFKVRAGSDTAGTTTFNGFTGARKLGGVLASSIIITEYTA